jgi:hypothetical protein
VRWWYVGESTARPSYAFAASTVRWWFGWCTAGQVDEYKGVNEGHGMRQDMGACSVKII